MCLGIPARLVDGDTGHPDLAMADMGGAAQGGAALDASPCPAPKALVDPSRAVMPLLSPGPGGWRGPWPHP